MKLSAVVAMSENRVIGKDNQLPWHLPADLRHFKQITMGKPILMGRKTFESIGRALPGRTNIVITRDSHFNAPNCLVVNSIETALVSAGDQEEVFVIGGAQLFQQMLAQIQRLYLTVIHKNFDGDAFFPELNMNEWREIKHENHEPDDQNKYDYSFIMLDRI